MLPASSGRGSCSTSRLFPFEIYTLAEDHFAEAERLIGRFAFPQRLRTLDALQLAVALDLYQQSLLDYFVIADRALPETRRVGEPQGYQPGNRRSTGKVNP
jgi:hypothetical protein